MSEPQSDRERRLGELEERVHDLERRLEAERTLAARRARRERWLRIVFWIAVGLAYVIYLQRITDML